MSITSAARRVAHLLKAKNCKVVFAESCTGGFVGGALTKIPGISNYLCGSLVVYRNETKTAWLDIPPATLSDPGPVGTVVTQLMVQNAMAKTPEADLALSITGHLGPHAPPELDGVVFISIAWRKATGSRPATKCHRFQCKRTDSRAVRQRAVIEHALKLLGNALDSAK